MGKFSGAGALALLAVICTACAATAGSEHRDQRSRPSIENGRIDRWDPAMDAIVPKDWKIEKLADGFGWAEGPIWIKSGGYLLFTDVPGNKMWKWSEKGGLEKFLDPSGAATFDPAIWREAGANGLAIFDANSILLADTGNRGIQRLDLATKKKTPVAMSFEGKKFSSPNDVTRMKNGVMFFTDPPYGFKKFDDAPEKEIPFNGVFRMGTDGKVTAIEKELHPAQRRGAVARRERAVRGAVGRQQGHHQWPIRSTRTATSPARSCSTTPPIWRSRTHPGAPDGLTVAADGTVFATGPGGVLVLSKDGKRLGRIWDGKQTANCKFGDDGRTLYMTSHDMLARIRLNIKGAGF